MPKKLTKKQILQIKKRKKIIQLRRKKQKQIQKQRQLQYQKQIQRQKQLQKQRTFLITKQITGRTITPPGIKIPTTFTGFLFTPDIKGFKRTGEISYKTTSFPQEYTPSLEATTFKIEGVKPPEEIYRMGLGLRPIVRRRKKRGKK